MVSYKDAGVDIEAGDAFVEAIKPSAAASTRPGVMGALGGFGALFDLRAAASRIRSSSPRPTASAPS